MRSSLKRIRGAALVIALLLTALGAAVATQMIVPLSGWLDQVYQFERTPWFFPTSPVQQMSIGGV